MPKISPVTPTPPMANASGAGATRGKMPVTPATPGNTNTIAVASTPIFPPTANPASITKGTNSRQSMQRSPKMTRTDAPGSQPLTRAASGMAAAKLGAAMSEDNSPAPSKFCWMLQAARLNTAKYGIRNWLSKSSSFWAYLSYQRTRLIDLRLHTWLSPDS
jgi:hypothetical protein